MVAVCRNPWEIIDGIYILFPIKVKFAFNLITGIPVELGLAGGWAIGSRFYFLYNYK